MNAGLTQILSDGTNTYLYGADRIAQVNTGTNYFPSTCSGQRLTDAGGAVTYTGANDPGVYPEPWRRGVTAQTFGASQTRYGFTGEYTDPGGMVYLRARYYLPGDGRFLTRDTWMGDYNSPLSLNRWMYVEGNPINHSDPSGLYAELALFKSGQEYGPIEKATWSSDEMRLVNQALWNIAAAYARAYNSYAIQFVESDCLPQPVEALYGIPLGWRIDPYEAFWRIHGGRVTFYKHDHKYKRVYTDDQGKAVTEELDNFGLGPNKNSVYIYPNGEYSVYKFGKGDAILSEANYIRFVTHEMGHVFDHAIGDKGRSTTTGNLAGGGDNASTNGFCGTYSTSRAGWQWRARGSNEAWEYFADMFVGWAYRCWETDPLRPSGLSETGELRSNFMNENMSKWIYQKINGR